MKKLSILLFVVILFGSCETKQSITNDIDAIRQKRQQAEVSYHALSDSLMNLKSDYDKLKSDVHVMAAESQGKQPCYILKLQLRQVSYSLSIKKQLRDALNTVEFDIPVNKQYYEQVNVGDDLVDGFRVGSLIMRGSFGNWRVKIESKHIEIR